MTTIRAEPRVNAPGSETELAISGDGKNATYAVSMALREGHHRHHRPLRRRRRHRHHRAFAVRVLVRLWIYAPSVFVQP
jgi:hypothetical protein